MFSSGLQLLVLICLFSFVAAAAEKESYACGCIVVSEDHEVVSTFQVSSELELDCSDYIGLEVPFNNPHPGGLRSPQLFGVLSACKAVSELEAPPFKHRAERFPYWMQSPSDEEYRN